MGRGELQGNQDNVQERRGAGEQTPRSCQEQGVGRGRQWGWTGRRANHKPSYM